MASARRLESAVTLPSQRPPLHWRTRADPLAEVWASEVVLMLEGALTALSAQQVAQHPRPPTGAPGAAR